MNRRTAGRLAWGVALLCFAIVVARLVLLYFDRAVIGSVGTRNLSNLIPPSPSGRSGRSSHPAGRRTPSGG